MDDLDGRINWKGQIFRWGPVILGMGAIFLLSARHDLPAVPYLNAVTFGDKIEHAIAYGLLGGLIWRALSRDTPQWWQVGATVAIAAIYGLTDEYHQYYVPGRNFDLLDLAADAFGALIVAGILTLWTGGDNNERRTESGEGLRGQRQETGKSGRNA